MNIADIIAEYDRAARRLGLVARRPEPAAEVDRGGRRAGARVTPWGAVGPKGVYRTPAGRYAAKLRTGGRVVHLGTFGTAEAAGVAVAAAEGGRA